MDIEAMAREVIERGEKATARPWHVCNNGCCRCGLVWSRQADACVHYPPDIKDIDPVPSQHQAHTDSTYIAAAANHAPALAAFALAALRRLSDADLDAVMAELGGER